MQNISDEAVVHSRTIVKRNCDDKLVLAISATRDTRKSSLLLKAAQLYSETPCRKTSDGENI